jgi:glycosyltransferase involved in cell wall biosynthesis
MVHQEKDFLSIIICVYNMAREAPRTILSALPPYQKYLDGSEYEVIVVDNGSSQRMDAELIKRAAGNIKFVQYPGKSVSPVFAINWAVKHVAKGNRIMLCIDGARLFSDELVASSIKYSNIHENTFIYSLGWHLGPKTQNISSQEGYTEDVEDRILADIDWYNHPNKLFSVSVLAEASSGGFFSPIAESNAFVVSKKMLDRNGGFNERFVSPGGGLANLEIFSRYVLNRQVIPVCLLADGTFHQFHKGAATSGKISWGEMSKEYESIFGNVYQPPVYETLYAGAFRKDLSNLYADSLQSLKYFY